MATSIETMKRGLRTRQRILRYLVDFITTHGYAPSTRQIANGVELASTYSVRWHLDSLEEDGYIRRVPSVPRSITVVNDQAVEEFLAEDLSFD